MVEIVTLTMNPAVDVSTSVGQVRPIHKMRCDAARRDPGGGGINVARVVRRFDADVLAIYPAGGPIGQLLSHLVAETGIRSQSVSISRDTREDFTVLDVEKQEQYRFVLPGPILNDNEWGACLDALTFLEHFPRFVVASGSLPPGVPEDFYARIIRIAKGRGGRAIIDTSGSALKCALEAGAYLIKPSLRELREAVGESLEQEHDFVAACRRLVEAGRAEAIALTLGRNGALLVARNVVLRADALPIKPVSAVGAGDSFLGAMVVRLATGHDMEDAFRHGVAAGSAALLTPGTDLAHRRDVERLLPDVVVRRLK